MFTSNLLHILLHEVLFPPSVGQCGRDSLSTLSPEAGRQVWREIGACRGRVVDRKRLADLVAL